MEHSNPLVVSNRPSRPTHKLLSPHIGNALLLLDLPVFEYRRVVHLSRKRAKEVDVSLDEVESKRQCSGGDLT